MALVDYYAVAGRPSYLIFSLDSPPTSVSDGAGGLGAATGVAWAAGRAVGTQVAGNLYRAVVPALPVGVAFWSSYVQAGGSPSYSADTHLETEAYGATGGNYLSVAGLAARTGADASDASGLLAAAISAAAAAVAAAIGFDPQAATYTTESDGYGTRNLAVGPAWPVTAVSLVEERQDDGTYTTLTADTDYRQDGTAPVLVRLNGVWRGDIVRGWGRLASSYERRSGAYRVTFTAGWNPVPGDIVAAGYAEAAVYYRSAKTGLGTVLSSTVDGLSATVSQLQTAAGQPGDRPKLLSPVAANLLRPYIRRSLGRG